MVVLPALGMLKMTKIEFPSNKATLQQRINSVEQSLYTASTDELYMIISQVADDARKDDARRLLSDARHLEGRIELMRGNNEIAQSVLQQVMDAPSTSNATKKQARANFAVSLYNQGEYGLAFQELQALKADLSAQNDPKIYVFTLNYLAAIFSETWQIRSARRHYQEAMMLASKIEDTIRLAYLKLALGNMERYVHNYRKSQMLYEEGQKHIQGIAVHPELSAEFAWQQAITAAALGDYQLTEENLDIGIILASESNLTTLKIQLLIEQARLCFLSNKFVNSKAFSSIYDALEYAYWQSREGQNIELMTRALYTFVATSLLTYMGAVMPQDTLSRVRFLHTLLPKNIVDDASQQTFTSLKLRRAESYFWNTYRQIQLNPTLGRSVENTIAAIKMILFEWLRPTEEAPPNLYKVVPKEGTP